MHRNPVRVVFCQILFDLFYNQHVVVKKGKDDTTSYPRFSKLALNRWHLAVTLMRNPQLQRHRVYPDVPKYLLQPTDVETTDMQPFNEADSTSLPSLKHSVNNDEKFLLQNLPHHKKLHYVWFCETCMLFSMRCMWDLMLFFHLPQESTCKLAVSIFIQSRW